MILLVINIGIAYYLTMYNYNNLNEGNVAIYKGLFSELLSGQVMVITVYTFLSIC